MPGDTAEDRTLLLRFPRRARGGHLRDCIAESQALIDDSEAVQS